MVWAGTLVLVHSIASDDEASPVVFDRWLFSWQSAKAFDALLRSGSDQIAWRDDYCGGFFAQYVWTKRATAPWVRAWQYTLMRTL
jgi:hypothetical protein